MEFTEDDYQQAATKLNVPVASVKAVAKVESRGEPFWPDGKVPILFEAQHFSRLTDHKWDDTHPNVSSRTWNRALYKGGSAEYGRLDEAKALDPDAALQSASWGAFQIMGFNWKSLGYTSVSEMVAMMKTTGGQLDSFVRFIKENHLASAMRAFPEMQACRNFAAGYNGMGAIDEYAPKIADAFNEFSTETT